MARLPGQGGENHDRDRDKKEKQISHQKILEEAQEANMLKSLNRWRNNPLARKNKEDHLPALNFLYSFPSVPLGPKLAKMPSLYDQENLKISRGELICDRTCKWNIHENRSLGMNIDLTDLRLWQKIGNGRKNNSLMKEDNSLLNGIPLTSEDGVTEEEEKAKAEWLVAPLPMQTGYTELSSKGLKKKRRLGNGHVNDENIDENDTEAIERKVNREIQKVKKAFLYADNNILARHPSYIPNSKQQKKQHISNTANKDDQIQVEWSVELLPMFEYDENQSDELDLNKTQVKSYGETWFENTKIVKIDDESIRQLSRSGDHQVGRLGQGQKNQVQEEEISMPLFLAPLEGEENSNLNSIEEKERIGYLYKSIKDNEYEKYKETDPNEKIYDYLYDVKLKYATRKDIQKEDTTYENQKKNLPFSLLLFLNKGQKQKSSQTNSQASFGYAKYCWTEENCAVQRHHEEKKKKNSDKKRKAIALYHDEEMNH